MFCVVDLSENADMSKHRTPCPRLMVLLVSLLAIAGTGAVVLAADEPDEIAIALQEAADLESENQYVALNKVTKHLEAGRPLSAEQLRQYFEICGKMINAGGGSPKQAAIALGRAAKRQPEIGRAHV